MDVIREKVMRLCRICGQEFVPVAGRRKECSEDCKSFRVREYQVRYRAGLVPRKPWMRVFNPKKVGPNILQCVVCGVEFIGSHARVCGRKCWHRGRRGGNSRRSTCIVCGKNLLTSHAKVCGRECGVIQYWGSGGYKSPKYVKYMREYRRRPEIRERLRLQQKMRKELRGQLKFSILLAQLNREVRHDSVD